MRKLAVVIPVLAAVAVIFSCGKKEPSQSISSRIEESRAVREDSGESAPGTPDASDYGYVLRVNASLMVLAGADTGDEADKLQWGEAMALGEKVVVTGARKATWNNRVYDFFRIRRDTGKEGFAFDTQVSRGGNLGVVIDEKANLYRTPKNIDVTGNILSRKIVVAYFPETERDGFVQIRAYDSIADAYRSNYIRMISLSTGDADVQSSILLQTAEILKDEGADKIRKDALLEAALLDYSASVFSAEIRAIVNPVTAVEIAVRSPSNSRMVVYSDSVNVRDLPDSVAGKVIGRLEYDTEVAVGEETVDTYLVDGFRDRWYHVVQPVEGWVFGAYLSE
jgi:hypothetical protein